jgi:hypothetical protein
MRTLNGIAMANDRFTQAQLFVFDDFRSRDLVQSDRS